MESKAECSPSPSTSICGPVKAYLRWMKAEGHTQEIPHIQFLKYEQKVLATFHAAQVQKLLAFKTKSGSQKRAHAPTC